MAATTQNQQEDRKVIRLPLPIRGIAKRDGQKRLPALTSADVEDFFSHADARNQIRRIAA